MQTTSHQTINSPEQRAARITSAQRKSARQLADKLNAVIHFRNLYCIENGARYINATAEYGNVFVHDLYSGVGTLYQPNAFRDGSGNVITLI